MPVFHLQKAGCRDGIRKSARVRSRHITTVVDMPKPHPNCFALRKAAEEEGARRYIGLMRYLGF